MTDDLPEVQAAQPSAMDRFWLETARSVSKESIAALEDAAKQLISITSLTQGIYFAAISFSDLKKALVVHDLQGWLLVFLFASPILLWLVSLAYAVRVFAPETYKTNLQSPDLAREMLQEIVAYKHSQLKLAHKALLLGFVLLVVNIIVYLGWIPQVMSK
jgi:hypothetical protein